MVSDTLEQRRERWRHRLRRGAAIGTCCLHLLFGGVAHAFQTVLEDRYVLHDDDTVSKARELLHSRLREEGARQAGSYVARETTLTESGELAESVTVMTAAMIEAETLEETLTVNKEGRPVLSLLVRLAIEDEVLQERIAALHRDQRQQLVLERLTLENRRLQAELRALIDTTFDAAEASERARRAERLLGSLSNNRQAVSDLVDSQALAEQVDASLERRATLQQAFLAKGAELAMAMNERMRVEVDQVTHRGDMLQLEISVTGLGDYRRELAQLVGLPFDEHGMIDRFDLETMAQEDAERFFASFEVLASFPLFIKVEASQPGAHDGRFAVASQLLLGTTWVRATMQGPQVGAAAEVRPDEAARIAQSNTLPRNMALAVVRESTSDAVEVRANGDLRVSLQLAAEGGVPERLQARALHLPWGFYRNQMGRER
ncbi:hypothetical protein [Halomonas sp. LBP4]|uniref:hypothetical protein n=1 Tax=Halomonas sp. LBP4 TaxID=2044917 RepID=UPI000D75E9B8|nr:hypothetical protein [Halomonas sp. LBP4]PXX95979.1 hypothetical protein CR157_17460 [Halomonas sp. LBP4]